MIAFLLRIAEPHLGLASLLEKPLTVLVGASLGRRRRLEHWGEVFALHKDCEYLGHQSKNMLQILIEHRGEMPERAQGFKPMDIDEQALQIELIVSDVARTDLPMACVLRGFYCGSGRRKVERWQQSNSLLRDQKLRPLSVRTYLSTAELGFERARGRLEGLALKAA